MESISTFLCIFSMNELEYSNRKDRVLLFLLYDKRLITDLTGQRDIKKIIIAK